MSNPDPRHWKVLDVLIGHLSDVTDLCWFQQVAYLYVNILYLCTCDVCMYICIYIHVYIKVYVCHMISCAPLSFDRFASLNEEQMAFARGDLQDGLSLEDVMDKVSSVSIITCLPLFSISL